MITAPSTARPPATCLRQYENITITPHPDTYPDIREIGVEGNPR